MDLNLAKKLLRIFISRRFELILFAPIELHIELTFKNVCRIKRSKFAHSRPAPSSPRVPARNRIRDSSSRSTHPRPNSLPPSVPRPEPAPNYPEGTAPTCHHLVILGRLLAMCLLLCPCLRFLILFRGLGFFS